ncbi:agamous-like MADS-box protein TM6 [Euphorbia lathyris]|uniref:agamous-like MADS-box protein TM6 n=1 Tax=Euphorbia lathyris TaxID=212925 RepID=UPI00331352E7
MGRGKIEMKKIENAAKMQLSFSKRRYGLYKKAQQLNLLCDAHISLIIRSPTGRFYDFITPTTTAKKMIDRYQKTKKIDLWHTLYQKMKEDLEKLTERNDMLKREIGQRRGKDLDGLSFAQLFQLEQEMNSTLDAVRLLQVRDVKVKTYTLHKQVTSLDGTHERLKHEIAILEGDYLTDVTVANPNSEYGVTHLLTYRPHRGHPVMVMKDA